MQGPRRSPIRRARSGLSIHEKPLEMEKMSLMKKAEILDQI